MEVPRPDALRCSSNLAIPRIAGIVSWIIARLILVKGSGKKDPNTSRSALWSCLTWFKSKPRSKSLLVEASTTKSLEKDERFPFKSSHPI